MAYFRFLIVACFFSVAGSAFAGFAQMSPPAGWGGSAGGYSMPSSANSPTFNGGFRGAGGSMGIGGRAVTMPAAYRFAANAGRFAAGFAFRNPAIAGAAMVAGWIADQCIGVVDGAWKITCGPGTGVLSSGSEYHMNGDAVGGYFPTLAQACASGAAYYKSKYPGIYTGTYGMNSGCFLNAYNGGGDQYSVSIRPSSCASGWYWTSSACTPQPQPIPLTEPDFVERVGDKPMPADLPKVIPGPWPVLPPVINPTPGDNPVPQPFNVPDGLPRPIPGTDPVQYQQPEVRVTPVPTPLNPWQVDIQPISTPVPDATPRPDPYTPPSTDPEPQPDEKTDLCKEHPDILACQRLDNPDDVDIPNKDVLVNVSPDGGWGPSIGACPAPKIAVFLGQQIPVPLDAACQFASGLRPVVLAMAWLSAALMLVGLARKGD